MPLLRHPCLQLDERCAPLRQAGQKRVSLGHQRAHAVERRRRHAGGAPGVERNPPGLGLPRQLGVAGLERGQPLRHQAARLRQAVAYREPAALDLVDRVARLDPRRHLAGARSQRAALPRRLGECLLDRLDGGIGRGGGGGGAQQTLGGLGALGESRQRDGLRGRRRHLVGTPGAAGGHEHDEHERERAHGAAVPRLRRGVHAAPGPCVGIEVRRRRAGTRAGRPSGTGAFVASLRRARAGRRDRRMAGRREGRMPSS